MLSNQDKKAIGKPHLSALLSIRWKSIFIAIVSALLSIVFLLIVLIQANSQAHLLEDIRDRSYPMQGEYQQAYFTLKTIQALFEDAVLTGETDSLQEADFAKDEFLAITANITRYDQDKTTNIDEISSTFLAYYQNSYHLAEVIIDTLGEFNDQKQADENTQHYLSLVELLNTAKEAEYSNVNEAIKNVSDNEQTIINIGIPVAALAIIVLLVLSFITSQSITNRIAEIVALLKRIAEDSDDMSARIRIQGTDEMAELAFWFNQFIEKLQKLTTKSTNEIKRLAYTDPLTNLPNRRYFINYLREEIERRSQEDGKLAVMFLDLDNFKTINDTFGHDAGDVLVIEVGNRIKTILSNHDKHAKKTQSTKKLKSVVARMGGDEFMVVTPHFRAIEDIKILAEKILAGVVPPIDIDKSQVEVGVSIGVAVYPENALKHQDIIIKADLAMYEAKDRGRNTYVIFDDTLELTMERSVALEKSLAALVSGQFNNQFYMHYQPKFNAKTGQIVSAEALIRWYSPSLGNVSPAEFIPIAEKRNIILNLDLWVINTVLTQIQHWRNRGINTVPIAINLSAKNAALPNASQLILDLLAAYQLEPNCIEIEITETAALVNIDIVADNIRKLSQNGIKVAIDDFGTGHTSLALFLHCKIDSLKIDQSFISKIENDSKTIIEGIITLATALGMKTVAEGVENQEQLETLKLMNCDYAQGFLLARPMNANEFIACLNPNNEKQHNA